eukprot:GHUV01035124.1.p1 GENE.GHUV01035124.1~~GHUV01035124.1.p1  ORF type:complete len:127 (+),score=26.26 GHUV01035124.1:523-903(+)
MLRIARADLDNQIHRLEWAFKMGEIRPQDMSKNEQELERLRLDRERVKDQHTVLLKEHHEAFHPVWGQLLKTGYQNSRYGHQIDRFACLYTSHVANMAFYSPDTTYTGRIDYMAHEDIFGDDAAQN